jgi:hypothetical protein
MCRTLTNILYTNYLSHNSKPNNELLFSRRMINCAYMQTRKPSIFAEEYEKNAVYAKLC